MDLSKISQYLEHSMNPDPLIRRQAEQYLNGVEGTPNYPLMLLMTVESENLPMNIRLAASIAFKNFIKRNWAGDDSTTGDSGHIPENNKISEDDRSAIKTTIVVLMLKSAPSIQKQFSDAVSFIGRYDFPKKWPQLMDMLVLKFAKGNFHEINGILRTAHSLFKRYRFEFKSQALWEEIKYVLDKLAKPLTDLFAATLGLRSVHADNPESLKTIYESLALMGKVFYSLNYQDLPEFFEDNMAVWMPAFYDLLTTDVPCLRAASNDSDEPGVLEQLRAQICENLCLYAQKYDEEFGPYMPQFVTAVWELLVNTGIETRYDSLVSYALNFLATVADRNHYRHLFEDPNVLESICSKVVVPNVKFRESDEELFEDNAEEYIRRDIEGSDVDTRRRAACDLVKTLSQNFEQKIFEIFSQYLGALLANNSQDEKLSWRDKDTAIFLVTSLASKGSTQKHGVTQTSELVPLPQFFQQQILPELMREDVNALPVLKADALKFVIAFRNILGPQNLLSCLPLIIRHLRSESVVVHTYAASAIEKFFVMKTPDNKPIFSQAELAPFAGDVLSSLFATLLLPGSSENEYVMKAIMRSFSSFQEASMPFMGVALPRLTEILNLVSKNPSRPHFNHYLFESLSLATKIVCKVEPNAVTSFEEALFPVFQSILQQDILEFIPYVFQMLSLLLEIRETGSMSIPEPYWVLFPCLLTPTLWDRPGNVTPLIRLLSAFIRQGSQQIIAYDKLNAILGVFQKMIASKTNDHEGFHLIQTLLEFFPMAQLQPCIKQIFALLFQRLSLAKTTKYVRCLIVFFSFYAAKVSSTNLIQLVDEIQAQMFGMVLDRVLIPDMNRVSTEIDKKIVSVGVSKILCETPAMTSPPYVNFWPRLLESLIQIFELPPDTSTLEGDHFIEVDDAPGYQVAYSQLNYAQPKSLDPFANIPDGRRFLAESLQKMSVANPGQLQSLVGQLPTLHREVLMKYCAQFGVQIG